MFRLGKNLNAAGHVLNHPPQTDQRSIADTGDDGFETICGCFNDAHDQFKAGNDKLHRDRLRRSFEYEVALPAKAHSVAERIAKRQPPRRARQIVCRSFMTLSNATIRSSPPAINSLAPVPL